jgi:neutral ceramidase
MCRTVEQAFGNKPLAFFVQGAPGDINVFDAGTDMKQDAIARRDWAGETLGKAAASVAQQIQTSADPDPEIQFSEDPLPFKLRWDAKKFEAETVREMGPEAAKIFFTATPENLQLPVTTALIDRKIAIVGFPGEPFVEFQTDLRARCPVRDCFFLGYTNGYYGYFPTIRAATEGGYGAVSTTTWVEVGAGEQMESHGIIEIYRMLGSFGDTPNSNWISLPPGP